MYVRRDLRLPDSRQPYLLAKGLAVIASLVFIVLFASYQIGSINNREFNVRELLKGDYSLHRNKRDLEDDDPMTTDWPVISTLSTEITNDTLPLDSSSDSLNVTEPSNDTELTTNSTIEVLNITTITLEPTTTTEFIPTIPPTTEPLPDPCFREDYQLQNACDLSENMTSRYGVNVTLEDLSHLIFISRLMDRLQRVCPSGSWCLNDDWELRSDMMDFLDFCEIGTCLVGNIEKECVNDERKMIMSTLMLLCDVADENISDVCFLAIRKLTHITMLQQMQQQHEAKDVCTKDGPGENCTGACKNLAQDLFCMCESCNHSTINQFNQYSPWRWYFDMTTDDSFEFCSLNDTDCRAIESIGSWLTNLWNNINNINYIRTMDGRVVAAIIVAGLFSVAGIGFIVFACIKKGRSLVGYYSRDIVEYQTVDDEDDYDSP